MYHAYNRRLNVLITLYALGCMHNIYFGYFSFICFLYE